MTLRKMANETLHVINNRSTSVPPKADGDPFLVTQLVIFAVIITVTVVGNFFICWIELKRKPRKSSGYFIINLAISDLAVGLVSIPLDIAEHLSNGWPFFDFMCKVVYPLQTVLMAVSVTTLLCMSIERYRAVVTPFKSKLSGRFIVKVIISVWAMSILLVTPYTLVLKMKDGNCIEDWPSQDYVKIYTASVFAVLYLLPLTLISICYTKIGVYLHKEVKRWKSMIKSIRRMLKMSNARRMQNIEIIKAFVAAVLAFAICQLPTHVIWLWHDFGTGRSWKHLYDVLTFCHILTYLNSAIDPFIFGSLNARVLRKKFTSMFSCFKGRKWQRQNRGSGSRKVMLSQKPNTRRKGSGTRRNCLGPRCKRSRGKTMESYV